MKITKIDEIEDLADGVPVLIVEGAVKYASDVKQGKTGKTDWSRQFFVLTSGTAEVGCTLWDAEGNAMSKGESVRIENTQDKKGHWTGITKGSYSKEGKLNHTLEIRAEKVKITHPNGQQGAPSAFQQTKAAMQPTEDIFDVPPHDLQDADPYGQHGEVDGGPVESYDDPRSPANAPQSPPQQGARRETGIPGFAKREYTHDSGPMSKDDYWQRKEDRDEERQRFIIRQHSQSMALEVLKLKGTLNELTVEDLTPAKLRQLADYFDNDVFLGTSK